MKCNYNKLVKKMMIKFGNRNKKNRSIRGKFRKRNKKFLMIFLVIKCLKAEEKRKIKELELEKKYEEDA